MVLLPAAPTCCGSAAAARLMPRSSAARRCGAALPPPSAAPYATSRAQRTQRRPTPPLHAATQQVASSGPSVAISLADVLVRDVMTKPPTLVRPDTSVFDVLEARWAARRGAEAATNCRVSGLSASARAAPLWRAHPPRRPCFSCLAHSAHASRGPWRGRAARKASLRGADTPRLFPCRFWFSLTPRHRAPSAARQQEHQRRARGGLRRQSPRHDQARSPDRHTRPRFSLLAPALTRLDPAAATTCWCSTPRPATWTRRTACFPRSGAARSLGAA